MKKTPLFLLLLCCAILGGLTKSFAQAPAGMSYQAVVRDASNTLLANQAVGMRISLLQGNANGSVVYTETHTPVTNANGLVSIEIGSGTVISGNFDSIVWAAGPYFIKTETDPSGGNNYSLTSTQQLLSVPYALYARKSGNPTLKAGSGINIQNDTIINTAPHQQVNLTGSGLTTVSGSYPNLHVNTPPYAAGTGIDITGASIHAKKDSALWNANKLQNSDIDTSTPQVGDMLKFDGAKWTPYHMISEIPVGTILSFGGRNIPNGWLLCDGTEISRISYPNLFLAIDTSWGAGNSSNTFNLPDLRGQFLRGVSSNSNNDPQANIRTRKYNNGNTGNNIGTYQNDEIKSHSHTVPVYQFGGGSQGASPGSLFMNYQASTSFTGGDETRPKNAYVYFIIKY